MIEWHLCLFQFSVWCDVSFVFCSIPQMVTAMWLYGSRFSQT